MYCMFVMWKWCYGFFMRCSIILLAEKMCLAYVLLNHANNIGLPLLYTIANSFFFFKYKTEMFWQQNNKMCAILSALTMRHYSAFQTKIHWRVSPGCSLYFFRFICMMELQFCIASEYCDILLLRGICKMYELLSKLIETKKEKKHRNSQTPTVLTFTGNKQTVRCE